MNLGVGDLATWVGVSFSFLTGVAAVVVFVQLRQRERRQALTELHASLTSGETAQARNTLGTLLYGVDPSDHPPRLDCIAAYFALIWALQRARNVFRTFSLPWKLLDTSQRRIVQLLGGNRTRDASLALSWNLIEVAANVVRFHDEYGSRWQVEDKDAWIEISLYVDAARIRAQMDSAVRSGDPGASAPQSNPGRRDQRTVRE